MAKKLMILLVLLCVFFSTLGLGAQSLDEFESSLQVSRDDVYVEARSDGYHIFVRRKPLMGSIMLTESFEMEDRAKSLDTYALRSEGYNLVNGDEKRILNGKYLNTSSGYFLIDSTPEYDERFGEAFHILIPNKVVFGYKDSSNRYGVHNLEDYRSRGEPYWFSIRAFTLPYADYTGLYKDNGYELFFLNANDDRRSPQLNLNKAKPLLPPSVEELQYNHGLAESFKKFSRSLDISEGREDLLAKIDRILSSVNKQAYSDSLDLAFVIDATRSMQDDILFLRQKVLEVLQKESGRVGHLRVGFVFYKDYMEDFLTQTFDFVDDLSYLKKMLATIEVSGGGDVEEAIYEGLQAASRQLSWKSSQRLLVLIGDAPAHSTPRGQVDYDETVKELRQKKIWVHSIMLPFNNS